MKITILLPHYKTREMTAFSVSQFLKYRGQHDVNILIIDNGNGVGLDLIPKDPKVLTITYPADQMQSHGIAFDYALATRPELIQDHFITVESDAFPTQPNWLDYYEARLNDGYDLIGSLLKLSGGHFVHPAGAMYLKSNWAHAMATIAHYGYHYYDSAGPGGYHLMTKEKLEGEEMEKKRLRYLPLSLGVFHQGMGFKHDNFKTYGQRTMDTEPPCILPRDGEPQYLRVAYEPGQWLAYWHAAMGKRMHFIPTNGVWMPGKVDQQQEYSLTANGFKHLWGITAYSECNDPRLKDIIDFKRKQAEEVCRGN